jgi:DNA-binding transcriptional LysR family regulator
MELSDLRIFRSVVREGGVTRAAERLNRVQSNVTTRVRQLEDNLGVPLFLREGRRLQLAPAGRILLDYADRLLDLAAEAKAAVQDTAPCGLFRLGSMESTAAVRLPAPLAEFNKRYPQVELSLTTGNPTQLATALLAGEMDAALVAEPVAKAKFDSVTAFEEEPVIVTSKAHPPIDKGGQVPKTMIVFEQGCPHRERLEAWYARRGEIQKKLRIEEAANDFLQLVFQQRPIVFVLDRIPRHEPLFAGRQRTDSRRNPIADDQSQIGRASCRERV